MNNPKIKIATLNLCLGLKNKKEEIKRLIHENKIDILCVQESEIPIDYPVRLLTFSGYNYENESNDVKSRCGIYVSNYVSYVRRHDIEIKNLHIVIIDLNDPIKTRIINMYRTFSPQTNQTQLEFFETQIAMLGSVVTNNTILLGDFNLDHRKRFDINYSHKNYYSILNPIIQNNNLSQIVNFDTWSRVINNVKHSSVIDHIYVNVPVNTLNLAHHTPTFGDHLLITFLINYKSSTPKQTFKRNWILYSKEKLKILLSQQNWDIKNDDVQAYWNNFESNLIEVVDTICPIKESNNLKQSMPKPPCHIKRKINRRNNLLKKIKHNPLVAPSARNEIKILNYDIKKYFYQIRGNSIRRNIIPGNSKSLWDAVKIAKDINLDPLPEEMYHNQNKISQSTLSGAFAQFF